MSREEDAVTINKLPGSQGEHDVQIDFNTEKKALAFYNKQVLSELAPLMCEFIEAQEMMFVSTADQNGECDCSYRAGSPGFITVVDKKTIIYPEYNGNGVMASVGNLSENPNIGLLLIDFFQTTIGLHINGKVKIVKSDALDKVLEGAVDLIDKLNAVDSSSKVTCYLLIEVEEAYKHCSKHIPLLEKMDKTIHWCTDSVLHKGGDAFDVKKHPRPWVSEDHI